MQAPAASLCSSQGEQVSLLIVVLLINGFGLSWGWLWIAVPLYFLHLLRTD